MNTILTYFEPLESMDQVDQRELVTLFKQAWSGWSIIELKKTHASKHCRFQEMLDHLEPLPDVTPVGYREQCFLRWLAFDALELHDAPILILDYDVFPTSEVPDFNWFAERFKEPTILDGLNPCALFLPSSRFLSAIVDMLFLETVPDNESQGPHVGDNTVFCQHWKSIGGRMDHSTISYLHSKTQKHMIHFANCTIPTGVRKNEFVDTFFSNGRHL